MRDVDISFLKELPELGNEVEVHIQPLAPLSMVAELPGSYYKSLKSPSKRMISGLFENILGWHFDAADRLKISKELSKIRKKQNLNFPKPEGSTYIPLLMEFFKVKIVAIPNTFNYDDYWSRAYRRADAKVHPKGTFNLDYGLIPQKRELGRNTKNKAQVSDKELEKFFKKNINQFPLYYSTPTTREFVVVNGIYKLKLAIDQKLLNGLLDCCQENNMAYLGNSEGWVDIKLYEQ